MKEFNEAKQKLNELCNSNNLDLIEKRERLEDIVVNYGRLNKEKLWIEPEGIDCQKLEEGPSIVFRGLYDSLEFIGFYVKEDSFYLLTPRSYFRKDYGENPYLKLKKAFTRILGHEETDIVLNCYGVLETWWEEDI
ncbi:MAG: hypothetical protein PWQ87_655 [Candidatus Woesearchaeota archaeon]|nr:hypothetical protein [Candidatus Woesearchaeota archaeon]